jgi:hypothetical protein
MSEYVTVFPDGTIEIELPELPEWLVARLFPRVAPVVVPAAPIANKQKKHVSFAATVIINAPVAATQKKSVLFAEDTSVCPHWISPSSKCNRCK